ncbi:glycosyltransferase family 2 protein [Candidatus Saganbacteria bacterium]|nr:glycosyltransferase family 2 protein [Candidatus Saganbacteria bacterium]
MNKPKVSIVILNWNQYFDTKECLASLMNTDYGNFEIILADNGSKDSSQIHIKNEFPGITLIENGKNLGFAEGSNVGIRLALSHGADYVLLLNNDTTVEPNFLSHLISAGQENRSAGILSPRIMQYSDKTKVWFSGGKFLPIIRKPAHDLSGSGETEWISGCSMLIKREVLGKIGMLDADYFNNYEDVDISIRARRAGYQLLIVPKAVIYHKFAASMGGKLSPFYTYFRTRNNLLFFKKTGQLIPLVLNLVIFPIYSLIESLKNRQFGSIRTTMLAIYDFASGKLGKGSMK